MRRWWILGGGLLLFAVAVVAGLFVSGVVVVPGHVAMPPADASPRQVVSAYVAAMNAHDCDTAKRLSATEGVDETALWCGDIAHLSVSFPEKYSVNRRGRVDMLVVLDIHWRPFHNDGTVPQGPYTWEYLLRRVHGAWRVFDQGQI